MGNASGKTPISIEYIQQNVQKLNNILISKTGIDAFMALKIDEALEIYQENIKSKSKQLTTNMEKLKHKLLELPRTQTPHQSTLLRGNSLNDIISSAKQLLQEIYDKVTSESITQPAQLKSYLTTLRQYSVLLNEKDYQKNRSEIVRIKKGISLAVTDLYIKFSLQEDHEEDNFLSDVELEIDNLKLRTLHGFHLSIHDLKMKVDMINDQKQKRSLLLDRLNKLELEVKIMKAEDFFGKIRDNVETYCQLDENDFPLNLQSKVQDLYSATEDIPEADEEMGVRKRNILMDIELLQFALNEKSKWKQFRYDDINVANLRKFCEGLHGKNADNLELEEMLAVANDLTSIIRDKLGVNRMDSGRKMTQIVESINSRKSKLGLMVPLPEPSGLRKSTDVLPTDKIYVSRSERITSPRLSTQSLIVGQNYYQANKR